MRLQLAAPMSEDLTEDEAIAISNFIHGCKPLRIERDDDGYVWFASARPQRDEPKDPEELTNEEEVIKEKIESEEEIIKEKPTPEEEIILQMNSPFINR